MGIYLWLGGLLVIAGTLEMLFQRGIHSWGLDNTELVARLRSRGGSKWTGPAMVITGLCFVATYFL
jgi:hypothetical protein